MDVSAGFPEYRRIKHLWAINYRNIPFHMKMNGNHAVHFPRLETFAFLVKEGLEK